MMRPLNGEKILIGPSSFAAIDDGPMKILSETGAEIIDNPYKRRLTRSELVKLLSDGVTGLVAGLEPLDREVMSGSDLKVISRCGSGMSNVDLEAAGEIGISVCSTPDAPVASVAELTLGAMLDLLRTISFMNNELHKGKWTKKIGLLLERKTVAIIGFGRIGQRLSEILMPFKVRILVVDPVLRVEKQAGITVASLEEALPQADIICVHSSGEDCLINSEEFKLMKPDALLLNAARGSLIDEKALIEALDNKRIAGAWLDVFEKEPYSGVLIGHPQVILTPHVGSYTRECRKMMETQAVENLIKAFIKIKDGKNGTEL